MTVTISTRALRILAAFSAAIAVIGMSSVAVAAWQSTASGDAQAHATTAKSSSISAVASVPADDLYPGATKTIQVSINNPNPYPVIVTSIGGGGSSLVSTGCVAGTVTSQGVSNASGVPQAGGTVKIPASGTGTYTLSTQMSPTADNSCQGQTFALTLSAILQSAA